MLTAILLTLAVSWDGGESAFASVAADVDYSNVKTNEDRLRFIRGFGLEVDPTPLEEENFLMPDSFDRVILGYNELQKQQGLDLSKYARKRVTRYTYNVNNYDHDGTVYANLFIFRGKIVACDVSSADPEGFVAPLTLVDSSDLKNAD